MPIPRKNQKELLDEYARLFSTAGLRKLEELGHDILVQKREGAWIYDASGKGYIDGDASAGTYNLGHRHPDLIAALKKAIQETEQGNFPMISIEKSALAEALAEFAPGDLDCAIFSVSRGETVEFSCKIARGFTGRPKLLSLSGGWHGESGFAMSLSEREDLADFGPLIPQAESIPFGDLEAARAAIDGDTAALILEPIQAENHCRMVDGEYLKELAGLLRSAGALLILDETQSGFGRCGAKFLCERLEIVPDMLILGEALGGGIFPMAATVITQRVNAFLNAHPMIHLSTFGGADHGCRVAQAAIEVYQEDEPWLNAAEMGGKLLKGLSDIAVSHDLGDEAVAGSGLLLSFDFGSPERARMLCREAAKHGLLIHPARVATGAVLLRPSLLITDEEIDRILVAMGKAAGEMDWE